MYEQQIFSFSSASKELELNIWDKRQSFEQLTWKQKEAYIWVRYMFDY